MDFKNCIQYVELENWQVQYNVKKQKKQNKITPLLLFGHHMLTLQF